MRLHQRILLAAGLACLLCSANVMAVMVAGDRGVAANGQKQKPPAQPPQASAPTIELISGVITSVDYVKKTITVAGKTLAWHPTQLRVFSTDGRQLSEMDLRAGQQVRFALEPSKAAATGDSGARRVVLVYVGARS